MLKCGLNIAVKGLIAVMNQVPDTPKIEFPCPDYPIKVVGESAPDFKEFVLGLVKLHDPTHNGEVEIRDSRKGTFQAVNVKILAISAAQIEALYIDLKASGRVKIVL